MADRISNLATSNLLMSYLGKTQNRLIDLQYQMSSQKVSPNYKGVSKSSQYLLGLEASHDTIAGYIKNNEIMDVRLNITNSAMDGILTNVNDFKKSLKTFDTQVGKTESNIKDIQQRAFNSLVSMQAYLNTSVGGRYIFSGGRTDKVPVDMNLTTLADFQATYDGAAVSYPTTSAAHTENFTIAKDSAAKTNWLTFEQDGDGNAATAGIGTITATTAQFSNVSVGSTIEITGTANNNGTYTVSGVTGGGTKLQVNTRMLTNETNNANAIILKPGNNVAQSDTVTLAGGVGAGDIFSVTVNGITLSATAGGADTLTTLRDNLVGQINAHATLGPLVTATANSNDAIDLIADAAGVAYTVTAGATDVAAVGAANTNTVSSVTANVTTPNTTLTATNFTDLTFNRANNRITVGAASLGTNALSSLTVGSTFTISGTAQNNGTYTVAAVAANGDTVDIVPKKLTDEGTAATPTLSFAGNQAFTVNAGDDTITAAAGTYSSLKTGMSVVIAGTASNNGTFTVTSVASDGSSINVREALTAEAAVASTAVVSNADGTVSSKKYYLGDDLTVSHRIDEDRSIDNALNGLDPAFEKAIRAMAIIAQGAYGTEGGLDQNIDRATNATYLLVSAYDGTASGTPPYGTENSSNVKDLLVTLSYQKVLISQTTESHVSYSGFLEAQISNIENSDPLETITRLLDDQRALEASYQTLARIRELSLMKYM